MGFNFIPEEMNLFPHARRFEEGQGKIREGQATILVALDGSGDCDTLQEAFTRVRRGGTIYIKEGVYNIYEDLNITNNNITISGSGYATEIKYMENISFNIDADYITFQNVRINGNNKQSDGIMISGFSNANIRVLNCWIENCNLNGIEVVDGVDNIRIEKNIIKDCDRGINFEGNNIGAIIKGNFVEDCSYGLSGARLQNSIINSNIFKGMAFNGIFFPDVQVNINNVIVGNRFEDITQECIFIGDASEDNIIVGNYLEEIAGNGSSNTIIQTDQSRVAIKVHREEELTFTNTAWTDIEFDLKIDEETTGKIGYKDEGEATEDKSIIEIKGMDDIIKFDGCVHLKWTGAAGTQVEFALRTLFSYDEGETWNETRCGKLFIRETRGANSTRSAVYVGSLKAEPNKTWVKIQVQTSSANLSLLGVNPDDPFQYNIAATLQMSNIGNNRGY